MRSTLHGSIFHSSMTSVWNVAVSDDLLQLGIISKQRIKAVCTLAVFLRHRWDNECLCSFIQVLNKHTSNPSSKKSYRWKKKQVNLNNYLPFSCIWDTNWRSETDTRETKQPPPQCVWQTLSCCSYRVSKGGERIIAVATLHFRRREELITVPSGCFLLRFTQHKYTRTAKTPFPSPLLSFHLQIPGVNHSHGSWSRSWERANMEQSIDDGACFTTGALPDSQFIVVLLSLILAHSLHQKHPA